MAVPMVQVRIVGMSVHHRRVPVHVDVRLTWRVIRSVLVLVVLIMHVGMLVYHLLMHMLVLMMFNEVQPQAHTHQHSGSN